MSPNSIKEQTISGILWSSIQRFGAMGISFIANLILARLLLPEDFGTLGVLMVFIAFANIFIDAGFGAALIQKKNPTSEDYSTVFYLNFIIAIVLYVIFYFSAPIISAYYRIPLLCDLLKVLGLVLFLNSFSIIQDNQLRKHLNFKKLSIISLTSSIVGASSGIIAAYLGLGVWSLVINILVTAFLQSVLLWYFSNWHPILMFSKKSLKELFPFGGFVLANSLMVTMRLNISSLIIGKLFSSRDLGFYTQAVKLESIPATSFSNIVGQVSFPMFSKIQDEKEHMKVMLKRSIESLAFVTFPLMILLIIIANSLFILLYTDKWVESVPYFRILCIGGLVTCLQDVSANFVMALGKSKLFFKWNFFKTTLIIVFIFLGTLFGIKGVIYGSVLGALSGYFINSCLASKVSGYLVIEQVKDLLPMLAISISIGVLTYFLGMTLKFNYIVTMVIQIIFYVTTYLGVSYLFKIKILMSFIRYKHN